MKNYKIPYNKPFLTGNETSYITDAVNSGKISGNGKYTNLCHQFFEKKYGFKRCLLTTSCTDALEMASILIDLKPEDEVIIPSYTFVSTANAFVLRGAKIIFADSSPSNPNIDTEKIERLITPKTKAIVIVHYAGFACDMDEIMDLSQKYNLFVIEDAAHAIDSYYKGKPLGGIGHFGTFSFHETKNIISGEGGMLVINDEKFIERAEIIWEKGTNRSAFFRGEIDKYSWVDIGSSFLPSEIVSAFLYAQLQQLDKIQEKRKKIWNTYYKELQFLEKYNVSLPKFENHSTINGHIFYILCNSSNERQKLIDFLKKNGILSVFHYLPLHLSDFYLKNEKKKKLIYSENYAEKLLRLPLYYHLSLKDVRNISNLIHEFFRKN